MLNLGKKYIWKHRKDEISVSPQVQRSMWIVVYWIIDFFAHGYLFNHFWHKHYEIKYTLRNFWDPLYGFSELKNAVLIHKWHVLDEHLYSLTVFFGMLFIEAVIFEILFRKTTLFGSIDDVDSHGNAHFATYKDLNQMGLLSEQDDTDGVILGRWYDKNMALSTKINRICHGKPLYYLLRDTGTDHVMGSFPTRGGKGVTFITDTSLEWRHSMVVLDIKGENWLLSSGYRSAELGQYCFRFDPTYDGSEETIKNEIEVFFTKQAAAKGEKLSYDELCTKVDDYYNKNKKYLGTARWNPLVDIHIGTQEETREVQQVATMLADPEGKGLNDYWSKAGYDLLSGAITLELYQKRRDNKEPSLRGVREILSDPKLKSNLTTTWLDSELMTYGEKTDIFNIGINDPHPTLKLVSGALAQKADEEFSGVLGFANAALVLFLDSTVGKNTTEGTFTIDNIVNADKPVSLYVIVPPTDLPRLRPLLRLFFVLMINGLTTRMKQDASSDEISAKHINRMLLLLDEFPQLKKMDQIQVALAQMAGFGIKALIVTQSYTQLQSEYGKEETVSGNCIIQMAGAPNDELTANILSAKTGKTTDIVGHMSESITPGKSFSKSISYSDTERPLMYPHEIMQMPPALKDKNGRIKKPGTMLVFFKGFPVIKCEQALFFQNKEWLRRTKIMPPLITVNVKERMQRIRLEIERWQQAHPRASVETLLKDKNSKLKTIDEKVIRKWFNPALRRNPKLQTPILKMYENQQMAKKNKNFDNKIEKEQEQTDEPKSA